MPELPEVEIVARGLAKRLVDQTVINVQVSNQKSFLADAADIQKHLIRARVLSVRRRQKLILIELSNGWMLVIHLKMTGQLIFLSSKKSFVGGHPEKVYTQSLPNKHTHVVINFSHGILYFNDLRKFGWMRLFTRRKETDSRHRSIEEFLQALMLGPEPLEGDFTVQWLKDRLQKRQIPIKQALMDQKIAAGVGNIYADEALFRAGIQPERLAKSLKIQEIAKLHRTIRDVLRLGIIRGGTSVNTYLNSEGTPGKMQAYLKVYGRRGQRCFKCKHLIKRIRIGQRSTHFCPVCQK
ncbi:bifunctional DNA-formamidopyrimidine glycosylase/DNA-(apurinic or apyrimidinic site) lyase [Candidatus Berkelbacteria bacterium]|nr:bifunctional DNA-formamidopyrimidine glycosylase/DNA-(apurinic or apyrimidinic site) lyase [Candidatus Berkelbacteria bacterium]